MAAAPGDGDPRHRGATAHLHNVGVALLRKNAVVRAARIFNAVVALAPDQEPSRHALQATMGHIQTQALHHVTSQPQHAVRQYAALLDLTSAAWSARPGFASLTERVLADIPRLIQERRLIGARRLGETVLEVEPAHSGALLSLAAVEHHIATVTGWPRVLRLAGRAVALEPHSAAASQQWEQWCLSAAEDVLNGVGSGDHGGALAILGAIATNTPDRHAAAQLEALRIDAQAVAITPQETAAGLLRWLAARHRKAERYQDAANCLERACRLSSAVAILAERADALRHRTVLDATAAAWAYAQVVIQGQPAHAGWGEHFHTLSRCAEALISGDGIDHRVRTRCWATLLGARALVAYTQAFAQNPLIPPSAPNPFLVPAIPRTAIPRTAVGGRRVYDGFTFFNEVELLEIRLHELHDVVERFVVVEATHTHAGVPKPLIFPDCRERFAAYADQIVHVVADLGGHSFAWQREAEQRDAIMRGLVDCRDDDLIIVSDLDEIPRRDVVERLRAEDAAVEGILRLEMELFFHCLNRRARRPWLGAAIAPFRIVRPLGTNLLRYLAKQEVGHVIPDAGWHFTWMGGAQRVLTKAQAYAHEENRAGMVLALTQHGTLPHGAPGAGEPCDIVPVDERFPALVRANADRLRAMGWIV